MKKLLVLLCIALSLSLIFASCGEDKAEETTDDGWSAIYRP